MAIHEKITRDIFDELLRYKAMTRVEFIKKFPYRTASVLEAIVKLKEQGIIDEPERLFDKTGRKSPRIEFNSGFGYFIGLEFTNTAATAIMIDNQGTIVQKAVIEANGKRYTSQDIDQAILALYDQLNVAPYRDSIRGIGVAEPGMVDAGGQIALRTISIPDRANVPVGAMLKEHCCIDNTVVIQECSAIAFAEYVSRLPKIKTNLFLLHLDRGIGAGFIQNGDFFVGDSFRVMEVGHWVANPTGPICQCGSRGCLEAICGFYGIRNRVEELLAGGAKTKLTLEDFSLQQFTAAVRQKDRVAELLAKDICEQISPLFSLVTTLLNPDLIVISGELANLDGLLIHTIEKTLRLRCLTSLVEKLKIEKRLVRTNAAAWGAALYVRKKYYCSGNMNTVSVQHVRNSVQI